MIRPTLPAHRRTRAFRPLNLERLEDRRTPAIFLVTNVNDAGAGSLRQAILDANANIDPNPDTILIQTAGTLSLTTGQFIIIDSVSIVGPGANNFAVNGNNTSRIFLVDDDQSGAIHVSISGMALVNANPGLGNGGAIASADDDLVLADLVISGNNANRGGGIDIGFNGRLTMDRCTITGNQANASGGGGLYLDNSVVAIVRDCTISGNTSNGDDGGGIYLDGDGTLMLVRSTVSFNSVAQNDGGGIYCDNTGDLTIQDSTIANNFSGGNGGGIYAGQTNMSIVNSTISGNTSQSDGGGIWIYGYNGGGGGVTGGGAPVPTAVISNSTIVNNTAVNYGGGIATARDVTISNSIISGNSADTDDDLYTEYGAFSLSFTLVQNKGNADINDISGNIFGVAALLENLQENGGPTLTHRLLCGSPGINAGDPTFKGLTTDQRGLPRVAGDQLDMGALETEFGWVRGTVFNDVNGNGIQDQGDAGIGNVFVWLDANNNRSPDNDEVFGRTDIDGNYELSALPGTYDVLHALPAGLRQTTADPGTVFVEAGEVDSDFDFGLQALPGLKAVAGAGPFAGSIQATVDQYRGLLGALNPNVSGTQNGGNGRREINWDGVPDNFAAPNNLPPDFFNKNSTRGVVFSTQGTGFQVSSVSIGDRGAFDDVRFGNLNDQYPDIFQTFSPERLFTPLGSTIHDVRFFVPGTNVPATVTGFGAVFVEVDNPVQSSLEFFDINGKSLGVFLVPKPEGFAERQNGEFENGLSFLGIQFTDGRRAASVRITTGHAEIGANDDFLSHDVVVLDDFIYGEPVASKAVPPEPPPTGPVVKLTAIGSGPGGNSAVSVYDVNGKQIGAFNAFDISFRGEVHVATADIDGDGVEDIITAAGPGGGPHVQVYSGKQLMNGIAQRIVSPLGSFFTYDPRFIGGVSIAAGDVNGDGRMDIISGAGPGGGPHVIAFSGKDATVITSFYAYDPSFLGGVNVAAGEMTGDGKFEIVTGPGPGGGPHVRVFDTANSNAIFKEFFAYTPNFLGGVYVGAGDLNGDNLADIVTGPGRNSGPHVIARDGQTLAIINQFYAYEAAFAGGVRVSVGDWNGDGFADILTGAGPGGGPHFRAINRNGNQLDSFYALFDQNFGGGIFVG